MFKKSRKNYPYISRFQLIYQDIIKQSKNIPVSTKLVNDIFSKFKNNIQLIYEKQDLIKLNQSYKNISKDINYSLRVIIIDQKNFISKIQKYQHFFIIESITDLIQQFKNNNGIYTKLTIGGLLILNYTKLKDNYNLLIDTIKHELTHYFQIQQNLQTKWIDLLPSNPNQLDTKTGIILISLFQYNMTYQDLYYLTCGKQFQAYCTSIQHNKDKFDKNILKNLTQEVLNGNILNQPTILRNLYLFIFLNSQFDKSKQRIKYIKNHLFSS